MNNYLELLPRELIYIVSSYLEDNEPYQLFRSLDKFFDSETLFRIKHSNLYSKFIKYNIKDIDYNIMLKEYHKNIYYEEIKNLNFNYTLVAFKDIITHINDNKINEYVINFIFLIKINEDYPNIIKYLPYFPNNILKNMIIYCIVNALNKETQIIKYLIFDIKYKDINIIHINQNDISSNGSNIFKIILYYLFLLKNDINDIDKISVTEFCFIYNSSTITAAKNNISMAIIDYYIFKLCDIILDNVR